MGGDDITKFVATLPDREYDPSDDHATPRTPQGRGLREGRVWHCDKANELLVENAGIRTRFARLATAVSTKAAKLTVSAKNVGGGLSPRGLG